MAGNLIPIPLDWAECEYLKLSDGRPRYIPGLALIARDMRRFGIEAYWGEPENGDIAECRYRHHVIVVSPRLQYAVPPVVKDTLSEETTHVIQGSDEWETQWWKIRGYPDWFEDLIW